MLREVTCPTVDVTLPGAPTATFHETVFTALAEQSEAFAQLRQRSVATWEDVHAETQRLLDDYEPADAPPAWRIIHTSTQYLGPAYFAIEGRALIHRCGPSTAWVTRSGFEIGTRNHTPNAFMAIESTGTRTSLVSDTGQLTGLLSAEEAVLAEHLAAGNSFATAVQASFQLAVQAPLHQLLDRLARADRGPLRIL